MSTIVRSALVGYSAREMYDLVEDIESYPGFLPWCRSARIIERKNGVTVEDGVTVAVLSVGLKGISQSFTTENTNTPGESIRMRLVEGPFTSFHAAWKFQALEERAAKIEFSMDYKLAGGLVARAIAPLFNHIADTMVDAFSRRARSVYGPAEG
jgi:ribosome-associated toxin RatA of RatAB toxin-antitoxin module